MTARRRIGTAERRARLVARHHLRRTAADAETAVRDLVAVHSSDPVTPYLALWARIPSFSVAHLDDALYRDRSLWRLHAMRRTLFVVPTDQARTMDAACGRDVARAERRKVERWVAQALDRDDAREWLRDVEERTLVVLADGRPRRTQELTADVDGLSLPITVGSGRWVASTPLSSRLLFVLAMEGHIVRAEPAGSWRSSQYRWANARRWFGQAPAGEAPVAEAPVAEAPAPAPIDAAEGAARLARSWLSAHGPATVTDLSWWTGWTVRATNAALTAIAAVEVELDGGGGGWVLPDDVGPAGDDRDGVALLPGLDPTVMGWKERHWYLGEHAPQLFDRNGNAGPTVWVDGRVVGAWAQRPSGEVVTAILDDVGAAVGQQIAAEAAALTAWLDGVVAIPRFRAPLERQLSA